MKKLFFLLPFFLLLQFSYGQKIATPDKIYGDLFIDVQMNRIFPDNKTFVDCTPKKDPALIVQDYKRLKNNPAIKFSLKEFVEANFILPQAPQSNYVTTEKDVIAHINNLWSVLKRQSDSAIKGSSLLPLPYPYIVPGGRFREIYYWDSYFTMLGLKESGQTEIIENMIKNFVFLINTYGHIPNGNRSYYLSRSQPPFFSLMIELLASIKGDAIYTEYLPALQKEYDYWMDKTAPTKHVVRMPDGSILNRYYDQLNIPRQESYAQDVTTKKASQNNPVIYRDLRSAAESGWDFGSRWFSDGKNIATIQTTKLIPVDLNCLLYHLESSLAKAYQQAGNENKSKSFERMAAKRKTAINKYCWSFKNGWYMDYNLVTKKHSTELVLAGIVPMFLQVANSSHIASTVATIRTKFLHPGGLVTSLKKTDQQWDAPSGWAPLEWMSIIGLENYQQKELAKTIAQRWVNLNVIAFQHTGKLMEKYNVIDKTEAGGGEYPSQDGFGWTNGVLLALIKKYNFKP
jgi:alpha,alpha-trehalase